MAGGPTFSGKHRVGSGRCTAQFGWRGRTTGSCPRTGGRGCAATCNRLRGAIECRRPSESAGGNDPRAGSSRDRRWRGRREHFRCGDKRKFHAEFGNRDGRHSGWCGAGNRYRERRQSFASGVAIDQQRRDSRSRETSGACIERGKRGIEASIRVRSYGKRGHRFDK